MLDYVQIVLFDFSCKFQNHNLETHYILIYYSNMGKYFLLFTYLNSFIYMCKEITCVVIGNCNLQFFKFFIQVYGFPQLRFFFHFREGFFILNKENKVKNTKCASITSASS